ncbi:MAG: ribonucleoside-diphosphate reductase beta chain, partial [Solirubrobacteraceae bacterium]|nr:ribonucleoside-diphosphate reductase beta chain [Solirubrobacteraceae bacterium]
MIAGYEHFAALARRLQWDQAAIDLRPDAAAWPDVDPQRRARLLALLAGFCVGETSVAEELGPFGDAA